MQRFFTFLLQDSSVGEACLTGYIEVKCDKAVCLKRHCLIVTKNFAFSLRSGVVSRKENIFCVRPIQGKRDKRLLKKDNTMHQILFNINTT